MKKKINKLKKPKTRLEYRDNEKLALVTELYNLKVNLNGRDLGLCELIEIWHNDEGDNVPSCFVYPTTKEEPYGLDDILFELFEDSIEIYWRP